MAEQHRLKLISWWPMHTTLQHVQKSMSARACICMNMWCTLLLGSAGEVRENKLKKKKSRQCKPPMAKWPSGHFQPIGTRSFLSTQPMAKWPSICKRGVNFSKRIRVLRCSGFWLFVKKTRQEVVQASKDSRKGALYCLTKKPGPFSHPEGIPPPSREPASSIYGQPLEFPSPIDLTWPEDFEMGR